MKRKLRLCLVFVAAACVLFSFPCQASWFTDLPGPPEHNIILVGVVRCQEDGKMKPVPGATVTIHAIRDCFGAPEQYYELPEPETAVTDENGLWVLSFGVSMGDIFATPEGFAGNIAIPCKSENIHIYGDLQKNPNLGTTYDQVTGRAGSLADLVKEMVSRAINFEASLPLFTVEIISYAAFVKTDNGCCDETRPVPTPLPISEPGPLPASDPSISTPQTTPDPSSTPEPATELPPSLPTGTKVDDPVRQYQSCVEKCKSFLAQLEALKNKRRELDESKSQRSQKLIKEIERLQELHKLNNKEFQQQKYITPEGGEHWGLIEFEAQYGANGYRSVPETQRTSPNVGPFLDMLKRKIAKAEAELNDLQNEDDKAKEAQRQKLDREISNTQKKYDGCVEDCGPKKATDIHTARRIIDFVRTRTRDTNPPTHEPPPPASTPPLSEPPAPTPPISEPPAIPEPPFSQPSIDTPTVPDAMPLDRPHDAVTGAPLPERSFAEQHFEAQPKAEEVQFKKIPGRDMNLETGIKYTPTPEGMDITTSTVATGGGAEFRRWEISDIRLNVDGEMIGPSEKEKFYIEKQSYFRGPAAATFVALGVAAGQEAESGEVCPVTGQKMEGSKKSAEERAATGAALGLLASQAKGEITATKAVFKLDHEQAQKVRDKKAKLDVTSKNSYTHKEERTQVSLR